MEAIGQVAEEDVSTPVIDLLLDHKKIDLDYINPFAIRQFNAVNAVEITLAHKLISIFKKLTVRGADIVTKYPIGGHYPTPLYHACVRSYSEISQLIFTQISQKEAFQKEFERILTLGLLPRDLIPLTISFIGSNSHDICHIQNRNGSTALHALAHNGFLRPPGHVVSCARLFLEKSKEECNVIDRLGRTPLRLALEDKNMELVDLLLEYGADPALVFNCSQVEEETKISLQKALKEHAAKQAARAAAASSASAPVAAAAATASSH